MNNFFDNLTTLFLFIIKTLSVNYIPISYYGHAVNKPILILCKEGRTDDVIRYIETPGATIISKLKHIYETIISTTAGPIIYKYTPDSKSDSFLHTLIRAAETHTLDCQSISSLFVIVSETIPLKISLDSFFVVSLDEIESSISPTEYELVPAKENISKVISEIKSVDKSLPIEERSLLCALSFISDKIEESEKNELCKAVSQMLEINNYAKYKYVTCDTFTTMLEKWQRKTCFNRIYKLPYLPEKAYKDQAQFIAYDDDYIYIRENMIKEIISESCDKSATRFIKESLKKSSIIETYATGYTVFMDYSNEAEKKPRLRMLKFHINKLTKDGEPNIINLCIASNGGKKNELRTLQ